MPNKPEEQSVEIDWSNDEVVVRAVYIEARPAEMTDNSWRIYDSKSLFRGAPLNVGAKDVLEAWKDARRHPNIQAFERAHNPAFLSTRESVTECKHSRSCSYSEVGEGGAVKLSGSRKCVDCGAVFSERKAFAPEPQPRGEQPLPDDTPNQREMDAAVAAYGESGIAVLYAKKSVRERQLIATLALVKQLTDALERTLGNYHNTVSRRPVRDMAETFAEAEAAIQSAREHLGE